MAKLLEIIGGLLLIVIVMYGVYSIGKRMDKAAYAEQELKELLKQKEKSDDANS